MVEVLYSAIVFHLLLHENDLNLEQRIAELGCQIDVGSTQCVKPRVAFD